MKATIANGRIRFVIKKEVGAYFKRKQGKQMDRFSDDVQHNAARYVRQ